MHNSIFPALLCPPPPPPPPPSEFMGTLAVGSGRCPFALRLPTNRRPLHTNYRRHPPCAKQLCTHHQPPPAHSTTHSFSRQPFSNYPPHPPLTPHHPQLTTTHPPPKPYQAPPANAPARAFTPHPPQFTGCATFNFHYLFFFGRKNSFMIF